tara:strand:- start:3319 stop:3558 length:240 start_codon:yes stop_codon:yes gene_type:complete
MKPGIFTTEFWLTAISTMGGLFMSVSPDNPWTQLAGAALMALTSGSYTVGRSMSKGKIESAESRSRVLAESVLKQELFK